MDAGADVKILIGDFDGNTPLHVAAEKGDYKKVQFLLAHGADSQITNFRQLTPLAVARSTEVINILKKGGDK